MVLPGRCAGSFVYVASVCDRDPDVIVSVSVSNPSKSAFDDGSIVSAAWFSFMLLPIVNPAWVLVVEPPESGMSGTWKVKLTRPCGTVTGIGGAPGMVCPSGWLRTSVG